MQAGVTMSPAVGTTRHAEIIKEEHQRNHKVRGGMPLYESLSYIYMILPQVCWSYVPEISWAEKI